jgi:DNA-binding NarL/FixJ family response regulator
VTDKIRIVLADDHPIVLDGLRNLIRAEPDFELVGEAASGLSALLSFASSARTSPCSTYRCPS